MLASAPLTQSTAESNNRRVDKWVRMLSTWPEGTGGYATLKRRVRAHGVPDTLRGYAWQLMLGSRELLLQNPQLFPRLLEREMDGELREIIKRDLGRTFTTNVMFLQAHSGECSDYQQTLYRILHAYAVYDPRVGYCQGMGFIAATLLTQMKEAEAFWAFVVLMRHEKYLLCDMFLPGFPKTQQGFRILTVLLERFSPRLAQHLEAECVNVSYFASRWLMTLFSNVFPVSRVLRVWDLFLVEGWKVMFRVSLALLLMEEESLLQMEMEELMTRLKTLHEDKDVVSLLALACSLKITNRELDLLSLALSEETAQY